MNSPSNNATWEINTVKERTNKTKIVILHVQQIAAVSNGDQFVYSCATRNKPIRIATNAVL